jgi:uncharacterized membrane protein
MTDSGLAQYAPPAKLNDIGSSVGALVARGDLVAAFEKALLEVKSLLLLGGFSAAPLERNELDDEVVMEKGA